MKKQLFIFSVLIIIVAILVSCSANNDNNGNSNIAVTDKQGTTHYYEIVTDNNGKPLTNNNSKYVTNEHKTTTVIDNKVTGSKIVSSSKNSKDTKVFETSDKADNNIDFKSNHEKTNSSVSVTASLPSTSASDNKETSSRNFSTTQIATDNDGWVDKWY